jgi:hypothetical protein
MKRFLLLWVESLGYAEKEPVEVLPDLNGTTNVVIYTNTSVISFPKCPDKKSEGNLDEESISTLEAETENLAVAEPLPASKDGHWFPRMLYSRIRYEVYLSPLSSNTFRLDISKGDDIWGRYFRIYLDGNKIHDQVIYSGFHSDVALWEVTGGVRRLEFEIYSGSYSEKAWKIDLFKFYLGSNDPASEPRVLSEFFPFNSHGKLIWKVKLGQQTQAEIKIENVDDNYARDLNVYVDGTQKYSGIVPCDITLSLGSYTQDSVHEIVLDVWWCDYREWGYKMPKFRVHYGGAAAEIDYLYSPSQGWNSMPTSDMLNYMQVYYVEHGYKRYSLFIDQGLNADVNGGEVTDWTEYNNIYHDYFTYQWYGVKYLLFGYYSWLGTNVVGWTWPKGGDMMFVATQSCANYAGYFGWWYGFDTYDVMLLAMMHECGHSIYIMDGSGTEEDPEVYCYNSHCIMHSVCVHNCVHASLNNCYYCQHHWDERLFPY